MECTRCGAGAEMLYPCPHCGRLYCGPHRYPRHGCVTDEERADVHDDPDRAEPAIRSMDVAQPVEPADPPAGVYEWMRRQTYLTFVASIGGTALVISTVFWVLFVVAARVLF